MDNQFTFIKAPNVPVTEQEVIDDLKKVSSEINSEKVTQRIICREREF